MLVGKVWKGTSFFLWLHVQALMMAVVLAVAEAVRLSQLPSVLQCSILHRSGHPQEVLSAYNHPQNRAETSVYA